MQPTRMPAKKIRIFDIANGKYFPGSKEDMRPSYIITPLGERISRVNIIATVTEKFLSDDGNYSSITIDDGTEAIRVKAFKETVPLLMGIEPGSLVLVIGKVKEFNGELYINGEVVKKDIDVNFESLRKLEILDKIIQQKKIAEEIRNMSSELSDEELKDYAKNKYSMTRKACRQYWKARSWRLTTSRRYWK